jgi:hypothetical protein
VNTKGLRHQRMLPGLPWDVPRCPRTRSRSPLAHAHHGSMIIRLWCIVRRVRAPRVTRPAARREILLLDHLREGVERFGFRAVLAPDRRALLVVDGTSHGASVWVSVDEERTCFCWIPSRQSHPVEDLPGAIFAIAACVRRESPSRSNQAC